MNLRNLNISIRAKIILAFGSTITILILSGVIVFNSFYDMKSSMEYLRTPDVKLAKINELLTELSLNENNFRAYLISSNKIHLNKYISTCDRVDKGIDSLFTISLSANNDKSDLHEISNLWEQKKSSAKELLKLYEEKEKQNFSQKLREKKYLSAPETLVVTKKIITREKIIYKDKPKSDSINTVVEEEKEEGKFLPRFFRNVFTRKEEKNEEPALEEEPAQEKIEVTNIYVDTLPNSISPKETEEEVIVTILEDIKALEVSSSKKINKRENEILEKDIELISLIRNLVSDLKRRELLRSVDNAAKAQIIIEKSIFKILFIGGGGILSILVFALVIISDVSKSIQLKNKLLLDKKQAEELASTKENFLATMSHEIRTPLNSILGFTEQLAQTKLLNRQNYFLQAIQSSTDHLLSLVNDILDLSRIDAGKINIEKEPFSLELTIKEVYKLFSGKAAEKGLSFRYSIGDTPQVLVGDKLRLKQILINLVSNAIKFTEKGEVFIICEGFKINQDTFMLSISVKDSGIGIPEDKIRNIFETFTQADSSITRRYGGTGLGLAITKKLTGFMEGNINVNSSYGTGSEFNIQIPFKISQKELNNNIISKPANTSLLNGLNVIVLEDDEFNLLLFHTVLSKWNMDVRLASNGEEALSMISEEYPDILITDIHMPDISGIEILRIIRKSNNYKIKTLPVLAVTAHVMNGSLQNLIQLGFDQVLYKPFRESELANALLEIIAHELTSDDKKTIQKQQMSLDLEDFTKFAEGDKEVIKQLINVFIKNAIIHLDNISIHQAGNNWSEISSIVHKMKPGFAYLNNSEIIAILNELEIILKEVDPESKEIAAIVENLKVKVLQQISLIENDKTIAN